MKKFKTKVNKMLTGDGVRMRAGSGEGGAGAGAGAGAGGEPIARTGAGT